MPNNLPDGIFISGDEALRAAVDKMLAEETRQVRRALLRDMDSRGLRWVYGQLIRNKYGRQQNVSNTAKTASSNTKG